MLYALMHFFQTSAQSCRKTGYQGLHRGVAVIIHKWLQEIPHPSGVLSCHSQGIDQYHRVRLFSTLSMLKAELCIRNLDIGLLDMQLCLAKETSLKMCLIPNAVVG